MLWIKLVIIGKDEDLHCPLPNCRTVTLTICVHETAIPVELLLLVNNKISEIALKLCCASFNDSCQGQTRIAQEFIRNDQLPPDAPEPWIPPSCWFTSHSPFNPFNKNHIKVHRVSKMVNPSMFPLLN